MGLLVLLAQCLAMFVASVLAGSLPLMFKSTMSGKRLKAISVLGMGLLVGAALTIIIPEGISTLYGSLPDGDNEQYAESVVKWIGISLLSGFALMLLIESLTPHPPHSPPSSPTSSPSSPSTPPYQENRPQPQHLNSSSPIIPRRLHIRDPRSSKSSGNGGGSGGSGSLAGLNATLGLVIHGAADGIALGASSLSEKGSLGLIVFLAVLVHKGPTALGLTTTLLGLKIDPPGIRKRLLIFSFAAPLGAIITYLVVLGFGGGGAGSGRHAKIDNLSWWTGIALLFSGGSFLYVATVIQPLSSPTPAHNQAHHTDAESGEEDDPPLGKYQRTGLLMLGMVLPILLSLLVGDHGH